MNVADLLADDVCSCLLHNCDVRNKSDESCKGHDVTQNKIVALYFTSNWCEPCHTFTKVLSQAHRAMEKRSAELVVINIPVESKPEQAKYCYETMPNSWYTVPSDNRHVKLVVCKPDGSAITYKGRSEIESRLSAAVYNWIDTAKPKPKQLVNGFELDDAPAEEVVNSETAS